MPQYKFDFSQPPIPPIASGKKLKKLTTTGSEELVKTVDDLADLQNTTRSELIYRYIVEGLKNDIGMIFMMQPQLDKSLREVLRKNF